MYKAYQLKHVSANHAWSFLIYLLQRSSFNSTHKYKKLSTQSHISNGYTAGVNQWELLHQARSLFSPLCNQAEYPYNAPTHTFPKHPQRSILSPIQSQKLRLLLFRSFFWNSLMSELRQVLQWIFGFKGLESPTLFLTQAGIYSWGWDTRDKSSSANLLEKLRHISYCQNHKAETCTKLS